MTDQSVTPINAYDITRDGTVQTVTSTWPSCISAGDYRWLHFDLTDPKFTNWAEDRLPRVAAKALLQSETRPRCEATDDGMILNLRGVNLNAGAEVEDMISVRLWVTDGLIVSARRHRIYAIDAIRADIDAGHPPKNIAAFLAALTFGLTKRIEKVSVGLEEDTDTLEDMSFDDKNPALENLSDMRQTIIKIRRFVRPQAEALLVLGEGNVWPLEPLDASHLRETINRNQRTLEELDATSDRLSAIQQHQDAKAATALGRNTYVLSIIAAIFLPLGFLTGLFGINVGGMPLISSDVGFWVVSGACLTIGIGVMLVFRFLRWL